MTTCMNGSNGQANNTRMIIKHIMAHVLDAEIITRNNWSHCFHSTDHVDPVQFRHAVPIENMVNPIRPAFAMTINKMQGQTLQQMDCTFLSLYSANFRLHSHKLEQENALKL